METFERYSYIILKRVVAHCGVLKVFDCLKVTKQQIYSVWIW
jgi:hypothetical protein